MPCPVYANECDDCQLCDEIGFCECHDSYCCGRADCECE